MKLRFIISVVLCCTSVYAVNPTIGITDIVLPNNGETISSFLNTNNNTYDDKATIQAIKAQLKNMSEQTRTQIAQKYSEITVVNVTSNTTAILNNRYSYTTNESQTAQNVRESDMVSWVSTSEKDPDFFMIGNISSLNAGATKVAIENTTKYSNIYNLDIAVLYQIIRANDQKVLATFIALGQAGSVRILDETDTPNYDTDTLINIASKDLVNSTLNQFNVLFSDNKFSLNADESNDTTTQ